MDQDLIDAFLAEDLEALEEMYGDQPIPEGWMSDHSAVTDFLAPTARIRCELTTEAVRARTDEGDARTIDQLRADLLLERVLDEPRSAGKVSRRRITMGEPVRSTVSGQSSGNRLPELSREYPRRGDDADGGRPRA
jgi:hypothetical protein